MELISAHALPKNKKIGEYVINKADFLSAEPWDMRIGPGLWGRFTNMIEPDDFHLKHHIYTDLACLPVKEFNVKMREVMAGTNEGKKIIKNIVKEVKAGLQEDEFNKAMNEISKKNDATMETNHDDTKKDKGFNFEDLFGNDDGESDGFKFDELF
jgi:hypothetical protein